MTVLQLTEKEIMLLKDIIAQEKLHVTKFSAYANQSQDTELASMFRTFADRERSNLNRVTEIFETGGGTRPTAST